jgi:hypothetical protein
MIINPNITEQVFNSEYITKIPELVQKDLGSNLFNLGLYIFGMVIYVLVIWFFYRHLSKRELFTKKFTHPKSGFWAFLSGIWGFLMYLFKSLIVFPLISSLWFIVLGSFLLFLSKSDDVAHILLMSITIISVARVTAYFNEDLARDVSKLIPFALLGVFIVDPTYFTIQGVLDKFSSLPIYSHTLIQYLIAIVILEFGLRTLHNLIDMVVERDLKKTETIELRDT